MSYLYETAGGQGFFIYINQNEIILRKKEGHQFYLPVIMVRDYKSDLNDTVYNSAIYYTYINENGALVVRSVLEYVFPFERQAGENVSFNSPSLTAFYGRLILFYMEKNTGEGEENYRLHGILPYEGEREILNVDLGNKEALYKVVCLNERMLVSVENEKGYVLYEASNDLQLVAQDRVENRNDQELAMLKSSLMEQQKEINFYKSQIESAKRQYQELMQVAEQYREEANHWSGKFT